MATIADWQKTASELQKRAKVFDTYAAHQSEFDSAKTNLAKELDSVAGAIVGVSKSSEGQADTAQSSSTTAAQNTTNDALKVATASVVAMQDALTGEVSIDDISKAAKSADEGCDAAFKAIRELNPTAVDAFVKSYKEKHPVIFDTGSQIKNNCSDILKAVSGITGWSGDYGTPEQAIAKINTNVQNIANGTAALALSVKSITDTVFTATGKSNTWIEHYLKDGCNICSNLGKAAAGLTKAVATGIGSFTSARTVIDALSHGNIASATGHAAAAIGGILSAGASITAAGVSAKTFGNTWDKDHEAHDEEKPTLRPKVEVNPAMAPVPDAGDKSSSSSSLTKSSTSKTVAEDDFSADLINEIQVSLDGGTTSEVSCCTVNGEKYMLTGYNISQELLQPMILSFSLDKINKLETNNDVIFKDSTQLIGKSIEITASSKKTSSESVSPKSAFLFKGVIIDVSSSRAVASAQSASVVAASYDCLLQNAPHCRSFENKSLKEIVEAVIQPYSDIKKLVNPRFADRIPYVVQYNQSDFAFIRMLAIRFGEWMYSTGTTFVFGEFDDTDCSLASLQYPGGSLMSYSLSQKMNTFSFNHLLNNHYSFGSANEIIKQTGRTQADSNYNEWTEKAYNASKQRLAQDQIMAMSAGGFDNQQDDEGADAITDYSIKVQAHGQKTGLMTVHGSSKLAMMKIGQSFEIDDNAQNVSGQNTDVKQNVLKVVGINHSFDYSQDYSNTFTAVPDNCKYPSYSNADVFPSAPCQRATVVDNKDEQKLGRIRVQFPWQKVQDANMKSPWLRIAVPYAGRGKGHQFIPEIGEEVMVGFEMDNAERPYIIGALYNGGTGKADEKWAASQSDGGTTNNVKAIRTRNGHTVEIHDVGNDGYIRIYDNEKENYILTFSTDDKLIKLESTGNIELYAKNDIIMNADHDIKVTAGHDRTTVVGRNDSLSVGSNQFINIGANKDEQIASRLQISAQNIRIEAGTNLNEYSTTHTIKATAATVMNAGATIDIKSPLTKVN